MVATPEYTGARGHTDKAPRTQAHTYHHSSRVTAWGTAPVSRDRWQQPVERGSHWRAPPSEGWPRPSPEESRGTPVREHHIQHVTPNMSPTNIRIWEGKIDYPNARLRKRWVSKRGSHKRQQAWVTATNPSTPACHATVILRAGLDSMRVNPASRQGEAAPSSRCTGTCSARTRRKLSSLCPETATIVRTTSRGTLDASTSMICFTSFSACAVITAWPPTGVGMSDMSDMDQSWRERDVPPPNAFDTATKQTREGATPSLNKSRRLQQHGVGSTVLWARMRL